MIPVTDINILITGGAQASKAVAAMLINQALTENGFSDVVMVSDTGKPISAINTLPSILDVIRNGSPSLFATPVSVQEIKTKAPTFRRPPKEREPMGPLL